MKVKITHHSLMQTFIECSKKVYVRSRFAADQCLTYLLNFSFKSYFGFQVCFVKFSAAVLLLKFKISRLFNWWPVAHFLAPVRAQSVPLMCSFKIKGDWKQVKKTATCVKILKDHQKAQRIITFTIKKYGSLKEAAIKKFCTVTLDLFFSTCARFHKVFKFQRT